MALLAINTASKEEFIALIKDNKVFMEKWIAKFDETSKVPRYLKTILQKSKTGFKDITHILVINGPGNFSSVRIGVTIANILAFALAIPVYSLTLDEFSSKFSMNLRKCEKSIAKGQLMGKTAAVPCYDRKPNITTKKQ